MSVLRSTEEKGAPAKERSEALDSVKSNERTKALGPIKGGKAGLSEIVELKAKGAIFREKSPEHPRKGHGLATRNQEAMLSQPGQTRQVLPRRKRGKACGCVHFEFCNFGYL